MATVQFTGKVIKIDEKSGVSARTGNTWRALSIEVEENMYNTLAVEMFGDEKINTFNLQVGETYDFECFLDGSRWNDKVFNKVSVKTATISNQSMAQETQTQVQQEQMPINQPVSQGDDTLPF